MLRSTGIVAMVVAFGWTLTAGSLANAQSATPSAKMAAPAAADAAPKADATAKVTPPVLVAPPECAPQPIPAGEAWTLEYSWDHGMGPGSVDLVIASDGKAVLTATPNGGKPTVQHVDVPADTMAKIVDALGKARLDCVHTVVRKGYIVFDIGRFALKFSRGATTSEAYVDECHVVDTNGFGIVMAEVRKLKPLVGESLDWGPMATASVPGDGCGKAAAMGGTKQ